MRKQSLLLKLPNELICYIAEFCNMLDIVRLIRCCHKLHNIFGVRIDYYANRNIVNITKTNIEYQCFTLDYIHVKHGEYRCYKNNTLHYIETYRYNKLHGLCMTYHLDKTGNATESIYSVYNKVNGLIQGEYKQYYNINTLHKQYMYKDDKKHGPFIIYYESGRIRKIGGYNNDIYHGNIQWFDESGKLCKSYNYNNGYLCGVSIKYDNGTKTKVITCKDGKYNVIEYYTSGVIMNNYNYTYKIGISKLLLQGNYKSYNTLGKLIGHKFYAKGKLHGIQYEYWYNGAICSIERYHKDIKHGKQVYYSLNGEIYRVVYYIYGEIYTNRFAKNDITDRRGYRISIV